MLLSAIRAIFILVMVGLAAQMASLAEIKDRTPRVITFTAVFVTAIVVVVIDLLTPRKRVQTISAVYFGVTVGLILGYFINLAVDPSLQMLLGDNYKEVVLGVKMLVQIVVCYICTSTILQTRDDFRFIIPYMEFSREVKGMRPLVLDTSVIIDGRIADVADTRIIDQPLIIPRFVLQELQGIADSSDKLRRNRGRRGLDILNRLQKSTGVEVRIHDVELEELNGVREVDQRLVILSKHLGGKVVTNDYNLNKIAKLQGVEVINLNDLANALKPIVLPGETLTVKMMKRGEEQGQGVGYLDDGTMIVVEQGAGRLGEMVRMVVTSVLQTSAGRMIFGRLESSPAPARGPSAPQENLGRTTREV